jgi:hypothetical protein
MSFREKQAAVTLLALWIVGLTLLFRFLRLAPATVEQALPLLTGGGVALIAVMILAHIGLVIGAGREEALRPADERDSLVNLASRRIGYWVTAGGLALVVGLAVRSASALTLAEAALSAFVLAEICVYASRLYYYRRGL